MHSDPNLVILQTALGIEDTIAIIVILGEGRYRKGCQQKFHEKTAINFHRTSNILRPRSALLLQNSGFRSKWSVS